MVSRSVAIALGIICIVLIVLVAYLSVTGISAQNSYNNLQNQNSNLQRIVDLNESMVLYSDETITASAGLDQLAPPYAATYSFNFIAPYSGYVSITIYNSTVDPTNVWVDYDNPAVLGLQHSAVALRTNDTTILPIFVSTTNSSVFFGIGFYNSTTYFNSATISITYYY